MRRNMGEKRSRKNRSSKRKKIVCFGEWFGQSNIDSPYYIFNEAMKDEDFKPYFIVKNKSLFSELNSKGIRCLFAYSLKGIITQIRCKNFVSSVNAKDFFVWALLGRRIYINIGHGAPFKDSFIWRKSSLIRFIIKMRMKTIDYYNFYGSPAEIFDKLLMKQYSYSSERIIRVPTARADRFCSMTDNEKLSFKNKLKLDPNKKIILFAPTHRDEGNTIDHIVKGVKVLQQWLENNNEEFEIILKPHFYDIPKTKLISSLGKIRLITTEIDINSLLALSDCLIGDYSGVVFDYYYNNKPVIGYCYDVDEYTSGHRGLYFKCDQVYNNIAYNINSLFDKLDDFKNDNLLSSKKEEFTDALESGNLSHIAWSNIKSKLI
ncbi:hypothetical protein EYV94_19980 [Puteibacter caeruleilacunae]|nr:hypothetical protein EYV94_19980 [Puteibacter caeruleilacunae]